ncbi:MAG: hypothetical protein K1X74_17465 [Pirellulales bacterium]|nr:hypothetical protein [Pirellulales bacterium]
MTPAELNRAVAQATGESLRTIESRGFSLIEPPDYEALTVDWDELDAQRPALLPQRQRS